MYLVKMVRDWLVSPGHRSLQRLHFRDLDDHPDVGEAPAAHPEVGRAKGHRRHNPGSISKIVKFSLQRFIHLCAENTRGSQINLM